VLFLSAAIPAVASASIAPRLALAPSTVSAGTVGPLGFDMTFSPSSGDYPSVVSLTLPPGLLLDIGLDNGICLNSTTPTAGCQLGTGTATSTLTTPVTLWLVKGSSAADVAGVALKNALGLVESTGNVTLTPQVGLDVALALPSGLSALSLDLSTVRAPTSCPSTPATVSLSATSNQVSTPQTTGAALPVTGCGSLAYLPNVSSSLDQDDNGSGAVFTATVTGAETNAATQALEIDLPSSIEPNVSTALGCLLGKPCAIGTASASSPLLPSSALSAGTIELGGSISAPSLTLTFPAPYQISLTGAINISTEALTFGGIPDLPLTSLSLVIGGGSSTQLFTTNCAPTTLSTKLTPWNGAASPTVLTPITFGGTCPATPGSGSSTGATAAEPTVSGVSLSDVVKGAAKLAFTVKQGTGASPISQIALSLPRGLSFTSAKAKLVKGIVVSGAHARKAKFTAAVKHGVLTIKLASATASAKVAITNPAITVGRKLSGAVRHELKTQKVSPLKFDFRLTDSSGTSTATAVHLKPKS
jgi:hypothetical protein